MPYYPAAVNSNTGRQNDTTNTIQGNTRIETGWGYMPGTTSVSQIAETVTFNTSFTTAPIVTVVYGGDSAAGTTYGSGGNNIEAGLHIKADGITTTSFSVRMFKSGGVPLGANGNYFYQWIAIGL